LPLVDEINELVENWLKDTKLGKIGKPKNIRDALTGTFVLREYEINILDLPMVQRLRRIGQTALASLTYPCTSHNRFQHTLGVTNIIERMVDGLRCRKEYADLLDENNLKELRLAALLHDVGHGPFSHASEEIMEQLPEVQNELVGNPKFSHIQSKPHEMLSYFIVSSDAFRKIIKQMNDIYAINVDATRVANIIVGDMDEPEREGFISDFLNGPFDADKLDYMPRDAYFSGLKMEVDLDRIAHTCLVDLRGGSNLRRLCSDISGAHNLEQILFNKILLYSSMYHHHKVRAALCMLKSIFEIIWDNNLEIDGISFKKAADFLLIDDFDILSTFRKEPLLKDVIEDIRDRRLLKRALVMSRKTAKDRYHFGKLTKLMEDPTEIRHLRELIADELKAKGCGLSVYDIWIDLPKPPSLREPSQCKVRITDKDYVDLAEVFPADWWLVAYSETKWKGHVFCPPQLETRELVNKAALKVFESIEGIEFLPTATDEAKIG
jgi:HD superfamily phosphohydrolase